MSTDIKKLNEDIKVKLTAEECKTIFEALQLKIKDPIDLYEAFKKRVTESMSADDFYIACKPQLESLNKELEKQGKIIVLDFTGYIPDQSVPFVDVAPLGIIIKKEQLYKIEIKTTSTPEQDELRRQRDQTLKALLEQFGDKNWQFQSEMTVGPQQTLINQEGLPILTNFSQHTEKYHSYFAQNEDKIHEVILQVKRTEEDLKKPG